MSHLFPALLKPYLVNAVAHNGAVSLEVSGSHALTVQHSGGPMHVARLSPQYARELAAALLLAAQTAVDRDGASPTGYEGN